MHNGAYWTLGDSLLGKLAETTLGVHVDLENLDMVIHMAPMHFFIAKHVFVNKYGHLGPVWTVSMVFHGKILFYPHFPSDFPPPPVVTK